MSWKWWSRKSQHTDDPLPAPGDSEQAAAASQPSVSRYTHLPEPVDPKEMVTSKPVEPPRDPEGGRDTERDFMLRYGAGGDDTPWDPTDG